jgi:hypothetical protein
MKRGNPLAIMMSWIANLDGNNYNAQFAGKLLPSRSISLKKLQIVVSYMFLWQPLTQETVS